MNWGFTSILCLMFAGLCMEIIRHGEQKKPSKYNGWSHLFAVAIQLALTLWAMHWRVN